ncbi:MAG: polyprenyl synthetase family protein [Bifidobacterium sp.]|nr:polyprenyl synthetase family protein [Bifidobacterium sp.]
MSSTPDLHRIEDRIAILVRRWAGVRDGEHVPAALAGTMRLTVDQAVRSSEGGKRLRALLATGTYALLAPTMAGTDHARTEAMTDLACAIEIFQTAALVHDDIIDDADLRRGKPAAHRALENGTGSRAIGQGLGLMLGDLLATACTQAADAASAALPQGDAVRAAFLAMQHDVEIGQVLDLAIERMPLDDPDALCRASYEVFRWKTASYTTIAPLRLAFLAAGIAPADADLHAEAIGLPLGVAFQLADDLLDVADSSEATGKPVGGDVREGKRTVLLADALSSADDRQARELRAIYEAPSRDDAQVARAIELFAATGAMDTSRARIANMWQLCRDAIGRLGLDGRRRDALEALCARFVPGVHGA